MQTSPQAQTSLEATIRSGDGWTAVALSGVIDERAEMEGLVASAPSDVLVVDTSAVIRINSVGVRTWVDWMRPLVRSGQRVVLIDASPAIMDQVNLVRNFAEGAVVHSFIAPYFCDRCDEEIEHRLDTWSLMSGTNGPAVPSFPCGKPACAKTFDDVEDDFLGFLEDQTEPDDREALELILSAAREGLAQTIAETAATTADAASTAAPTDPVAPATPRPPADLAFVGMLLVLATGLVLLLYLMLTLD